MMNSLLIFSLPFSGTEYGNLTTLHLLKHLQNTTASRVIPTPKYLGFKMLNILSLPWYHTLGTDLVFKNYHLQNILTPLVL